jgi:hypothetical protein
MLEACFMRSAANRDCILCREGNVVQVDFGSDPDPPAPRFPGAGALRQIGFEGANSTTPEAVAPQAA